MKARDLLISVGLVLATLAVYAQTFGADPLAPDAPAFEFVDYDDPPYVTNNPAILGGVTTRGIYWVLTSSHGANWHPATGISHMIDVDLFGVDPVPGDLDELPFLQRLGRTWLPGSAGHHATNVLFHVLNTLLVFLVLRSLTGASWRSAIVAGLFAVHPVHAESVAWVSERKDVLSTFFALSCIWAWARWVEKGGAARYAWVLVLLALGLMSKPMLVTLPFVLVLVDIWPLDRWPARRLSALLREKWPMFAMVAVSAVVTYLVQEDTGAVHSRHVPFPVRSLNAIVSYLRYLGKALVPQDLACFYPHPNFVGGTPWTVWQVAGALLLLVAITAVAFRSRKRYLIVGWLWYVGTLVPVVGFVQVGEQAMADRYTYIPLIGVTIAVVWLVADLAETFAVRRPWVRYAAGAAGCGLVLLLIVPGRSQAATWRTSQTLFDNAERIAPYSPMVLTNLGSLRQEERDIEGAMAYYRRALEVAEDFPPANYNMGFMYQILGQLSEAIRYYERAVAIDERHPYYHNNLANAFVARAQTNGDLTGPDIDEAVRHYLRALELLPTFADAHMNYANTLVMLGRRDEARAHYGEALAADPAYAGAHFNLGLMDRDDGNDLEAARHLREAARIDPNEPAFSYNLCWFLGTHPDESIRAPFDAILAGERASEATGHGDPLILDALGAAYAAAGRFDEALSTTRRALQVAQGAGMVELARDMQTRIGLYQKKQPYVAPR